MMRAVLLGSCLALLLTSQRPAGATTTSVERADKSFGALSRSEMAIKMAYEAAAKEDQKKEEATRKFAGIDFNVSFAIAFFSGDNERIEKAEVVDGVLRIRESRKASPSVMLESHKFVKTWGEEKTVGVGPFVGVLSSTEDMIDAFATGVMIGMRRGADDTHSFNVGIGAIWDPKIQTLGQGLQAGQALPGSETEVRYRDKDGAGFALLFSFGF